MKYKALGVGIACLAALAVGILFAQDKPKVASETPDKPKVVGETPARPADDAAVREVAQNLARAFEKGDAKAVAAFWTEEGEYMDESGTTVHGRAALEKAYAAFFTKRPELKITAKTDSLRFLGKDTAIDEGTYTVEAKGSPPDSGRFTTLYVRQDGQWKVALLKEWDNDTPEKPDLNKLGWLIGSWQTEGGDIQAQTTYEWSENKKFIRGKYSINNSKDKTLSASGTQIVGVDPATDMIRSWTFDSEGGIGEASWAWDGERWIIDSSGTLHDGTSTTARNMMQPKGDNGFTWRSVQRTHEGQKLPDLAAVQVKRVTK